MSRLLTPYERQVEGRSGSITIYGLTFRVSSWGATLEDWDLATLHDELPQANWEQQRAVYEVLAQLEVEPTNTKLPGKLAGVLEATFGDEADRRIQEAS